MSRKETGCPIGRDSIDLHAIQEYRKTGYKLKEILEDCREKDTRIVYHNKTVEPEWMIGVYKLIIDRVHEELRVEQNAGIKRALERKAQGKGSYGRPRAKLPTDFEKELKHRIEDKKSLSSYCEEIQMKKSTFYKWAKFYRELWNRDEEDKNCIQRHSS